ncbi:hypothetical protein RF11_02857 [Thelohanellus kitauei]|uniref:Fucosyltransferase n=1 Tax=Thelohanellus kitauei TaxID=669202 RepID=A0A0C2JIC1_THEKT|nr:hypothetical protein RF11_02857 [Thelohanellus kitauei]
MSKKFKEYYFKLNYSNGPSKNYFNHCKIDFEKKLFPGEKCICDLKHLKDMPISKLFENVFDVTALMSVHLILFIYFSIAHSRNLTTILIYGTFYDHVLLPHLTGIGCEHSHLFSVKRSNKVVDFDIIILHFIDHDRFMTEYLKRNFTSRKIMIESPYSVKETFTLSLSENVFTHWVFSYYKSSYFHVPYGYFKRKKYRTYQRKIKFKRKKKEIAGIISNCNVQNSVRLRYIHNLRNHVYISLYGDCFNHSISDRQREQILSSHKFTLAFENSHCEDYNTEKYWHAIVRGSIPIVMSYYKNLNHLIPGSYLDVFNFTNPKHLALHLKDVISSSKKEMYYHQWRKFYIPFIPKFSINGCEMLNMIHDLLESNGPEDATIYKLANISICMDPIHVKKMVMKNP